MPEPHRSVQRQMEDNDLSVVQDVVIGGVVGPLLGELGWQSACIFALAIGLITKIPKYISDRKSLEFVELLRVGAFSVDDLRTTHFCEGLRITIDAFMKERFAEKRKVIGNIYMKGFIPARDREQFRLERLLRTLSNLEPGDLIALKRVKELVIEPGTQQRIKEFERRKAAGELGEAKLEKYLEDHQVKGFHIDPESYAAIAKDLPYDISNLKLEGLLSVSNVGGTFGGPITHRSVTPFGVEFCEFIDAQVVAEK